MCWAGELHSGPVGAWPLPIGNRELLNDHDTLTSEFQKDLPSGPMEDAQERVSRRQGNQLTAIARFRARMIKTNKQAIHMEALDMDVTDFCKVESQDWPMN